MNATKDNIIELMSAYPQQWSKIIRKRSDLLLLIESTKIKYKFADTQLKEIVYCFLNDYNPICENGNLRTLRYYKAGFKNCGNKDKCKCNAAQSKKTCLEKYGVSSFSKTQQYLDKTKETKLERYNDANYVNPEKAKETKLDRYNDSGYVNPEKAKETKLYRYNDSGYVNPEKAKETKLYRYNDANYNNSDKTKETKLERYNDANYNNPDKTKETKLDRYNDANYNNSEKAKETNLTRYGSENVFAVQKFKDKAKETNIRKYGVSYHTQYRYDDGVLAKLNNKEFLLEQHISLKKSLTEISEDLNVNVTTISDYCKKHNIEVKYYSQSLPEKRLIEYIANMHNTTIISNIRSIIPPREIDIWLPEYKLAIEFNGKYWHHPDRYGGYNNWLLYHRSKEEECNKQGIELLHLWEGIDDHLLLIDQAISSSIINNDYELQIYD